jgi:vacuolar protein sorting-associated protein 13A/C
MIHLGAIKINITLRFEKRALNFDINQGFGALTIVYTLVTTIANMSDAPLSFKELLITNIFQSQASLINNLTKNYVRQGMFQFYKLIGSSDLLGNPVGFVDKLGSGVFEFFNEPRQGLIKGPKEFVGGVGKGVTSLVTGVVSASFDSVSKISGSLYNVAKSVTGQEALPHKRSENVAEGVYDGVVGGGKEIIGGVTGIFTKPFQGARQEGAKGFIKGVGKGVLGLVASPFTAVLRAGHSVTQGVTNTAIRIKKGKLPQYGRFRHPRYINSRSILEPYDEDFAEVNQILIKIDNGKFSKHNIKYFADFPIYKGFKKTKEEAVLIITEQTLLFCKNEKNMIYKAELHEINDIAVYEGGEDDEAKQKLYHLYVYAKRNKNHVFETIQYALVDKTYSILSKEKKTNKRVTSKEKKKSVKK